MQILSVTQSYYPFLDKGGPTVKVRALARGMSAAGHRSIVLSADQGFDAATRKAADAKPSPWGFEANENGVEAIYLRTRARYRALTWNPGVAAFARERLASCDVVHIYGLYDLIGPAVAAACRQARVPYVVEPMGMFKPIVRSIPLKRIYHLLMGEAMLEGAERIIATAEQERLELVEGGIPDGKVVVRRNGIDVPAQFPPLGVFRNQWKISPDDKLILFLGRIVSKKSPELLLEAFSRWRTRGTSHHRSKLVFSGPDEGDGFRESLGAQVAALKLNESVLFTGPLYDDAKWAAYREADLFVLPSSNENFGNTAAEAIASGTPVMVTDRCGIASIVNGRAGLVVSHDCAALEAGLAKILDDPIFAARLRAHCGEVTRSLGWAEPLAQMESIYKSLVSERLI